MPRFWTTYGNLKKSLLHLVLESKNQVFLLILNLSFG